MKSNTVLSGLDNPGLLGCLCLLLTLCSCHHKEFCYEHGRAVRVDLSFDWRYAPDASPACMEVFFFPVDGSETLYYQFQGREGGSVRMAPGRYRIVTFNGDCSSLNYSFQPLNYERLRVAASKSSSFNVLRHTSVVQLRKADMEIQDVVSPIDMIWSARDELEIPLAEEDSVLSRVLYPEKVLRTYSVEIREVQSLSHLRTASGTLSGMSGACYIGLDQLDNQKVSVPFPLEIRDDNSLYGRFYTFGPESSEPQQHGLNLYVTMDDGSPFYYTFDVTDQVLHAENPWNVNIRIDGLSLPEPEPSNKNMIFTIEDWLSIEMPVKM